MPQCQLVTGSGEVSPQLDGFVAATSLPRWGLNYQACGRARGTCIKACAAREERRSNAASPAFLVAQVVAILGPQSSGKSTLLNHLFGSKFTEMDAMSGRGQTTQV